MTIDDIFSNLPTLVTPRLLLWEATGAETGRFIRSLAAGERPPYHQAGGPTAAPLSAGIDGFGVHHPPYWSMVHKETDETIGCCAFTVWHLRHSRAELGFALAPEYRGQGYMTETLRTVIGFGFRVMELNRIEARCAPGNRAALRLLHTIGLREEMLLRGYRADDPAGGDRKLLSVLRAEWP